MSGAPKELHLTELINKFYNISKRNYSGKTYDNVLNIFDELSLEEQKALLRGALGVYVSTSSGLIHDKDLIDHGNSDALLRYLTRLKETVDNAPESVTSVAPGGVTTSSSNSKPVIDRPMTMGLMTIASLILFCIIFAATRDNDDSMKEVVFVKHLLEIIFIGVK